MAQTNAPVKTLAALNAMVADGHSRIMDLELDGEVWWSSATEGRIILRDDSAVAQLELHIPNAMPSMGDHLVLRGECVAFKSRDMITLATVPVVDHDGLHPPEEKMGATYLRAGRHPIRVTWFNRTDRLGLDLLMEGPDLPLQKVPDPMLFRQEIDAETGVTNFVNGVAYLGYEGQWWRRLPNFDHIPSLTAGMTENFDVDVRSRDSHVGLRFDGFIDIPKDGEYTFHLTSDDGSRLFIGESSMQLETRPSARPKPALRSGLDVEEADFIWTDIEGTVTAYHRKHGALEIDLMTKSGMVRLKVAQDSGRSYALRTGNRIRATGVSRKIRDVDGEWSRGEFFTQRWDDIESLQIAPRIWSEYPLVEIADLISGGESNVAGRVVRLKGEVSRPEDEGHPMLEDGSGQVRLEEALSDSRVGGSYNVLGRLEYVDAHWILRAVHLQALGDVGEHTEGLPLLTTAEEICQLTFEESVKGYPVRIKGVIMGALEYNGAILHDSSRGIYISSADPPMLRVGDYCEVEGVTGPFGFDPFVQASTIRKLGKGKLPAPIEPTWDQLINGAMHCNYVELEGVVASIGEDSVALLTRDGRINVRLNPFGAKLPSDALGATIRLRGSLLADWDGESRRVIVGSIYLDQSRVTVVQPAPEDPFAISLKHVGDLLRFDPEAGALQRVKVSGTLLYRDQQTCYLMDEEHGMRVVSKDAETAQMGDQLEVVGFVDLSGPSPLVRDAVIRQLGQGVLPAPRELEAGSLVRDAFDATRVQVAAEVIGVSAHSEGVTLEMQSGLRRFAAHLADATGLGGTLKPGSTVELTGVYVGLGGNRVLGQPIDAFELLVHSADDVRILSQPPWWTLKRMMSVVGLLFGFLVASLVWVKLLQKRVDERTRELGDQIRARQRIERERAIEHERARLAHDLHDDLGAGLTEVNMLSSLVKNPAIASDKKDHYADKMNELALRMVTSLDEIVWAENPSNDTVSSIADYFETYARRLLDPAAVGCIFYVADDVPDHPLGPQFRQGLFLAFKEALTNVLKHAEATEVRLTLSVQDADLLVVVSDNGRGIIPTEREAGSDGLVNMRKRMADLGGGCEIDGDPAHGTTICLRAPIRKVIT